MTEIIFVKKISVMENQKDQILKTCLDHFLKHGIRTMSNSKLAPMLGVSTKTLYKYFKNKEHLLEEATQLFHSQQYKMLEGLPTDGSAACLFYDLWLQGVAIEYSVNKAFFEDLHYYYPGLAKKVESEIGEKFQYQFLAIIKRGMAQGDFRETINPELALEGIFALYENLVRTERFKKFKLTSEEAFFNTLAIYIRGLCTKESLEVLDNHISSKYLTIIEK